MCFCVCKESNILVQRSTDPKLSLRAGQDRGARRCQQLEHADRAGRLKTLRASTLVHPNGDWPRAPRAPVPRLTRATAHPFSSCLFAIVCSKCGALSGPSTRSFLGDHCESQGDIIFGTKIDRRVAIETASYAALVADYLAVSWADKALAFLEPLLADTNTNPKPNRKKRKSNPLSPIPKWRHGTAIHSTTATMEASMDSCSTGHHRMAST